MPLFTDELLNRLPAESRAKVERLDADRDAAHAALRAASDAMQAAWRAHAMADAFARERLGMPRGYSVDVHPGAVVLAERAREGESDAEEARLLAPVHAAKRRLDAATAAHQRAVEVWERFAFLEDCAAWLEHIGPGVTFEHVVVQPPKSAKGFGVEVERIRKELAALDDQWAAAESAPAPKNDLLNRAVAEIDRIAERGRPDVNPRSRGGDPLRLAEQLAIGTRTVGSGENRSTSLVGNPAPFLVWAVRDQLTEKISAMVEALSDQGVLTDAQREEEFARIAARRLEVERAEESTILVAEAEGQAIARRRQADPRAILELIEV